MALDEADLDALVAEAAVILEEAAKPFVAGHRAESAVQKKGNDFATEVDLAIERQVVEALTNKTGIDVHGEEFGIPRWCGCSTRSTARSTMRPARRWPRSCSVSCARVNRWRA